jgi:hypothetical protein
MDFWVYGFMAGVEQKKRKGKAKKKQIVILFRLSFFFFLEAQLQNCSSTSP